MGLFSGFSTNCLSQWLHLNFGLPLWILPFLTILAEQHLGQILFFSNSTSKFNYILIYHYLYRTTLNPLIPARRDIKSYPNHKLGLVCVTVVVFLKSGCKDFWLSFGIWFVHSLT